ncbi:MAG: hypothetical protein K0S09_3133 [Sphingobacteriaceae bacterium]|jgi:hypothetical protein|nr:hypothetical protein [Sphingobacteriaceae bacterium]
MKLKLRLFVIYNFFNKKNKREFLISGVKRIFANQKERPKRWVFKVKTRNFTSRICQTLEK